MDLKAENPELNIQSLEHSTNEKRNIKVIYEEIDREGKVLKIEEEKNQKYKELEKKLKSYKSEYNKFWKKSKKTVKSIKETQKQPQNQEEGVKVRVKRYSKEGDKETINILAKIQKTENREKEAVIEFYKSYLEAAIKQKELFESLQKVGGDIKKSKKTINIDKLQKNADYLKQFNLKNDSQNQRIVDFYKENQNNIPPKTLLSESFLGLMRNKYQELEKEIQNFGNSGLEFLGFWSCSLMFSGAILSIQQSPCGDRIELLRKDQNTITEATEFKLLLQLLEDMGRKVPKFEITYEVN